MVALRLGCRCRPSVNTICGHVMIGLSLLSSVSKHNMRRVMIGLSLLSSVSKHNMLSYYDWVVVVFVSKHNMWSYYDWVVVVFLQ